MAIFIFHSIQLVCLCAFNSMKASILIIQTFRTLEYNFFQPYFYNFIKQNKKTKNKKKTTNNSKNKNKTKIKQEQIKNGLMFLSLKFLCCAGMSNRYVSELVCALQATLSKALQLQSSIRETTFFCFPEMLISFFLETAFSVVILGDNNSSFLPFRFTQLTELFVFEWMTVGLL